MHKFICLYKSIDLGDRKLLYHSLLAAAQMTVPRTAPWNIQVGIVMSLCCLLAVVIGRFAIQRAGEGGPRLPLEVPAIWERFGVPELLATMSFGHILGAGVILGLRNAGLM